jgi:hypothetical protein
MLSGRLTPDRQVDIPPETPRRPRDPSFPVPTIIEFEGRTVVQFRVPREELDALQAQDMVEVPILAEDE